MTLTVYTAPHPFPNPAYSVAPPYLVSQLSSTEILEKKYLTVLLFWPVLQVVLTAMFTFEQVS